MPYQAPEILDRSALGDDKYTVTELADGRKQLTPSPDSVSEPGTEINKALLQPMADTLARVDAAAVPYVLYWWRRRKVTSSGDWESVSAGTSDAYPTSGTSSGYDWAFLGRISDATVLLPDTARAQWKKITLTSANFSNNIANVAIKAKSALITVNCASGGGSAFGVLDVVNYVFHGIYINDQQYSQDRMAAVGTVSGDGYIQLDYYGSTNGTRLYMVAGGLKITAVNSSDHYVEINWLPLDSLEVGR